MTMPYPQPGKMPAQDNKERTVQAMFTSIAPRYDLNNSLLSFGRHHSWKRRALQLADLREGMTALDLCAGTGDVAILMGRQIHASHTTVTLNGQPPASPSKRGRVVAVDLNERMLSLGRTKIEREGLSQQIICLRGNAECLQFKDQSFDRVTVAFGIRNVVGLEEAFREIRRVLRPRGRMVCLEFSRPPRRAFRTIYDFYSFRILPFIGTLVSGDHTGVYRYLPDSIKGFPDQEGLRHLILRAGFGNVEYHNLTGGIVAIHVAWP